MLKDDLRAIVNISADRSVYVVFGPNRAIRESNLSSYGHLAPRIELYGLEKLPFSVPFAWRARSLEACMLISQRSRDGRSRRISTKKSRNSQSHTLSFSTLFEVKFSALAECEN